MIPTDCKHWKAVSKRHFSDTHPIVVLVTKDYWNWLGNCSTVFSQMRSLNYRATLYSSFEVLLHGLTVVNFVYSDI